MPRVPAQAGFARPQVSDEDLLMAAATMHEQGRLVEPDVADEVEVEDEVE